ncbi:hypothetical protein T4D_2085 [Trichinella pseudospiralis]|uniref:Uncharacterized protein n=1 Tax=Trichinella pseudospiralis TaxID=6337 RepID=A0A0V1FW50_TRIPS|nr:hypothetical protein T4D_2085 [Trichinella pseudospiralis]
MLPNVKEKWCVVLKTNDDLFLAASQLQSEALGFNCKIIYMDNQSNTQSNEIEKRGSSMLSRDGILHLFFMKT